MASNQRKTGVILSYVLLAIHTIVGFFYVPILLKYIGQNEYGLYQLMGSLVAYFSIMDFGLSSTVIRFYSEYDARADLRGIENTLGLARRIYYILTLIMLVLGAIIYFNIDNIFQSSLNSYEINESKKIFVLLLVNFIITLLTNIYTSIIMANEKFVFIRSLSIYQAVLQPFVIIALVMMSPRAFTIVLIQTAFNLFVGLAKYFYSKFILKVKVSYHYFDKNLLHRMLTFSAGVFTVSVVDQIFWKSNQIILGIISGTAVVAVYSVAAQIYMNYMPISTVIQGVFLPRITKLVSNQVADEELSDYFIRIGRIQFILLSCILIGFIVFGQEFITVWVGSNYMEAYWISLIILIPFTIDLIQNLGLTILQAKSLYTYRAKIYFITAIGSIILSLVLSVKFGAIGAAIATGFAMFVGNGIVMNIFYYKNVGIDIPRFWSQIAKLLLPICISFTSALILKNIFVIDNFITLAINGVIYVIVYVTSMWFLGMNNYEKKLISEPIIALMRR
jgi:O-antigen/teichoic acid export membrane protein